MSAESFAVVDEIGMNRVLMSTGPARRSLVQGCRRTGSLESRWQPAVTRSSPGRLTKLGLSCSLRKDLSSKGVPGRSQRSGLVLTEAARPYSFRTARGRFGSGSEWMPMVPQPSSYATRTVT
jgi:hypothetical protein